MINVTKSYLPPLDDYVKYLKGIWERNQLTNHGPLVEELENKLKEFLRVKHLFFVSNGTIALQIAIKALDLHGDILTTPFSYVATTSSIVWEGCRPIFVDIHPATLTLNPDLIEAAITPETTGILATHVYGYPCAVESIKQIANKHHLKVIYDAAHAFSVRYKGTSLMNYGDISTLSFHATKLFHTGEGGALVTNDDELADRISYMLNFGHKSVEEFWGVGINGKNSEFHAALGLCILPKVSELINKRRVISDLYDDLLKDSQLTRPNYLPKTFYNYSFYPVIFPSSQSLLKTIKALNEREIFPRRYFYPSLNTLPYLPYTSMPISENISQRILCLPLSNYLTFDEVNLISNILCDVLVLP
jgi:dTDP-4-amino-4,6-dideoxygalactose transaminase